MIGNNQFTAPWTPAEDEWIRHSYPTAFPESAARALPGRSSTAIKHRASRLGIKKDPAVVAAVNGRANRGRARTAENRSKISEALRGQRQSVDTRRKRSATLKTVAKRGPDNPNWKGKDITEDQSRWRARNTVPPGSCAHCAKPGTDVHHRDGNPLNNAPANLVRLCAKHHRQEHARMDRERRRMGGATG